MNAPHNQNRLAGARRAWAQPRFLLGAAAFALVGATWAAFAAPTTTPKAPVAMPHTSGKSSNKPVSLADLPAMVARYGEARRLAASPVATGGRVTRAVGTGQNGFNLVETDLTPNSPSDEREPVVSPNGDFIAFTSTGADSNNDGQIDSLSSGGRRHIWIMNRDGSGQRQLSGLNADDSARNQRHPTFSPDGNQIAYSDDDTSDANPGGSQLTIVDVLDTNLTPSQRTFFRAQILADGSTVPARVESPAWAPSGLSIAFVTNFDGRPSTPDGSRILRTRDIFSIAPDGSEISIARITGDPTTDALGDTADDDHPAYGINNINVLFFSSNRDTNGLLSGATPGDPNAGGRRIWRILGTGTGANQVTDPTQRSNGRADDVDDYPAPSTSSDATNGGDFIGAGGQPKSVEEQLAFQTNSFLDDSDFVDGSRGRDLNVWSLPINSRLFSSASSTTASETTGTVATVVTNILSSPKNFSDSRLAFPQTVDRAADREPAFSRTAATAQTLARIVFVSGRRFSPNTTSNSSTTPSNPFGGDQFGTDGGTDTGVTHDIWTTSTRDTTPPSLVPQGAGNLQYPVLAPQPNAPFFAPRTAEAGLKPNIIPTAADNTDEASRTAFTAKGGLRFAVVLRDVESGLNETVPGTTTPTTPASVSVSLFDADSPNFSIGRNDVNEGVNVEIAVELKADRIGGPYALNVYDDGPGDGSNGSGHEQQAGAVAGDGIYYCEGLLPTPTSAGDFYIDVLVRDRQNNLFNYDNIWGLSTRRFSRSSTLNNLFVSDYTAGQRFPLQLSSAFDDPRFDKMPPVESYYLSNPGGTAFLSGDPANADFNTITQISSPRTLPNVDVWRILCRGPVTQDVLNAFRPTITRQIDPNVPNPAPLPTATPLPGATPTPTPTAGPTPTPTSTPQPYTQLTRPVAVSRVAVIWGAPYAGTTFVGPGTITDSTTQAMLTSYLEDGGRLFISGRNIASGLTFTTGQSGNSFLANELGAAFAGENSSLTAEPGPGQFVGDFNRAYDTLQFGFRAIPDTNATDRNNFNDNAHVPGPFTNPGPGNYLFDIITSSGVQGAEITPAYTSGGTIGQRVERVRANGIRSRLVFFSFGFESVNRRYRQPTPGDGRIALNIRSRIASNILEYFRTSAVSGTVTTSGGASIASGSRVPNFLLRIDGPGGPYFVRTDANGNYFVSGLPNGGYTVRPFTQTRNGVTTTLPEGFFGGTPRGFTVGGGGTTTGVNLTVTPALPGGIIGRAVTSNGTFIDNIGVDTSRNDDTPIPNLPILVRSVNASPAFPNSGRFARLGATNTSGDFSVAGVPTLAEMQVIFNPSVQDVTDSGLPASSYSGPNPNFGRRLLPDGKRPLNPIVVPSGDNFILNDTGTVVVNGVTFTVDTSANPDTERDERVPVIVPSGPTISGVVSVNGVAVAGATVQLFRADGTPATNPVQTASGSGAVTGADGTFSFVDVSARTQANGGTPYFIRVRIVRDGITLIRNIPVTLFQGTDVTQTANFILATLTGKVVQGNNVPVSGATVTLQKADGTALTFANTDGTTFTLSRTARTDASGNYSLVNVPVGGYTYDPATKAFTQDANAAPSSTTRYNVFAQSGALTGSSGSVAVRAIDSNVVVPTIQLLNQQLTGRVFSQIVTANGNYTIPFAGATVELLDANGNSLSPVRTTTSASDGSYSFSGIGAGTYQIRASGKGDTVMSGIFTATAGASTGPDVTLVLHVVFGAVFDTANKGVGGATVTLTQRGVVIATTTSRADGNYQLEPVAARGNDTANNNFVVNATKGTQSGSTPLPGFARGQAPRPTSIVIKSAPVVTTLPTSFVVGRTYTFSMPYETSANAATRNIFDRTGGDATVPMSQAFNYGPTGINAANRTVRFYTVSRFNPNTLAYEAVADDGLLIRGEGYLLRVTDRPASGEQLRLLMPADNANLKPLTGPSAFQAQRFLVTLGFSASSTNSLNGRNLIGFPFNPMQFSSVLWDTTSTGTTAANTTTVQVQFGTQRLTLKDAVAAGIIFPSLTTIDPATGRTVNATSINAFGAYFVQARRPGVKLLLQMPQRNTN